MQNSLIGFEVFDETFLGINPAPSTAYAIVSCAEADPAKSDKITLLTSGVIETKSSQPDHVRLAHIHTELQKVIETHTPIAVGIYDVGFRRHGISKRQYMTSKVIGLVSSLAWGHDMKVFILDYMSHQAEQEMFVWKMTGEIIKDKRILNAVEAARGCATLFSVRK